MVAFCCCCNKKSKGKPDDATEGSEPLLKSAASSGDDDSIGSYFEQKEPSVLKKNASIGQSILVLDESISDIPDGIPKLGQSTSQSTAGNISITNFGREFDDNEIPTELDDKIEKHVSFGENTEYHV